MKSRLRVNSNAQTPALWGDLEVGSYAVGFKFIYQQDYSRDWNVAEDSNGYPLAIGRGRPVRISVCYPAKRQSNAPKMLYRDYMPSAAPNGAFMELNGLLEKRDVGNLRANLKSPARIQRAAQQIKGREGETVTLFVSVSVFP
jgi:hypothetical protein